MSAIHVHPDTKHRLAELAQTTGKAPADIVQEALDSYLDDLEDTEQAAAVLGRIERGEEGTITLDELERRLDLEG
ncbi:MAG: CopG family transcriptional regulator [Candidatus Competibacteraceae bacterium]|nr:CopG family transcriptional regulator [Candidatus Competibacteraceae bacterium]